MSAMPSKLRHTATSFDYEPLQGALDNPVIVPSNLDWTIPTVNNPASIDSIFQSNRGVIFENKVGEGLLTGADLHLRWWADLNPRLKVWVVWHSGNESPTVPGALLFDPIYMREIGGYIGVTDIKDFRRRLKEWLESPK
jgi:hypothetical protein